jgi:hypothetical protein
MSYLTIIQPDETFTHTPRLPDGSPSEAKLTLRVLADAEIKTLRKKHTKTEWQNGQRVSNVDGAALANDMIDASIVGWSGVHDSKGVPLPCERTFKLLLPERLQVDVVRLCAGKEAGFGLDEAGVGGDEGEAPSVSI